MKQQPLIGFLFALIAAMAWGSLPIALKQVLQVLNTQTIIFYRFITATLVLFLILWLSKKLPQKKQFSTYIWRMMFLGILGLAGNFFLFNSALIYIEPALAQIFIHLSSFAMLIVSVIVFKERLGLHQKIGLVLLMIGLLLFFNDRLALFLALNSMSTGIILAVLAALIWVAYGMAQKLMLRQFSSQQILLIIYFGCAIVFAPFADFGKVNELDGLTLLCFIYCCLNTIIGYGAYAEALNRWDVSKVSVLITLVPLFTIVFSHFAHSLSPENFANPSLNSISYLGAFVVVFGAMFSAIGHKLISRNT